MSITAISAAGLSQDVLAASNSTQQQALQSLQQSLASGDVVARSQPSKLCRRCFKTPRPLPEARCRVILSSRPTCLLWAAP